MPLPKNSPARTFVHALRDALEENQCALNPYILESIAKGDNGHCARCEKEIARMETVFMAALRKCGYV